MELEELNEAGEPALKNEIKKNKEKIAHLEQALFELNFNFDELFNMFPDILLVVKDGKVVKANRSFLYHTGFNLEDVLGQDWEDFLFPEDLASNRAACEILEYEPLVDFQSRIKKKQGGHVWAMWSAVTKDGSVFAIAKNITRSMDMELLTREQLGKIGNTCEALVAEFSDMKKAVKKKFMYGTFIGVISIAFLFSIFHLLTNNVKGVELATLIATLVFALAIGVYHFLRS